MNKLQKIGGFSALCLATIYIVAFMFFGVYFNFPSSAGAVEKLTYLAEKQVMLSVINLVMYVVFGVILAVLVQALYQRFKQRVAVLSQLAALFGIIWVGLVIASGMIANIGLAAVIKLSAKDVEQAMFMWQTLNVIVEGLGGGNEAVGGLWMLLLSIAAIKSNEFSKRLNSLGLFVGISGVLTIYPAEVLTEIFGIGQILWFLWLGITMLDKE